MLSDKSKNQLHLHLLVFIAGFTAILGQMITLEAVSLVWYRMLIAAVLMYAYIKYKKIDIVVSKRDTVKFFLAGIVIALHWITFFAAIKVSNISITLAMFSTGAFFASLIEPLFFKRKIVLYEIFFGLLVILGIIIIVQVQLDHIFGILLGVSSALFSTLFAVLNGRFIKQHKASVISFYEFISGVLFITLFLFIRRSEFPLSFFNISSSDLFYLTILASVCTAYAFIASVHVMRYISPYTVVLTYNLEPCYGIALAVLIFPESETMSVEFYIGACLIFFTIILNAIFKSKTQNFLHKKNNKI